MSTKKLTINAILLAIGAILHQITPAIGLPMQPDFSLIMLFIIILLNKNEYKTVMVAAVITGIFTALTTKFPGGQIPNMVDKVITANIIYIMVFIINKVKLVSSLSTKKRTNIIMAMVFLVGTIISGTIFLLSAQFIVGLPASFISLFVVTVLPASIINVSLGVLIYSSVKLSMNKLSYTI